MSQEPTRLDDHRHACRCKPWEQRWFPESPHRCLNCGGLFPAHTVKARAPHAGDHPLGVDVRRKRGWRP